MPLQMISWLRHMSVGVDTARLTRQNANKPLILIASIGNPSPQYDRTRHSVGHYLLEAYCERENLTDSRQLGRYNFRGRSGVLLYHNKGYMNVSGEGLVGPWMEVVREAEREQMNAALVVLSDELDLDLGKLKMRKQKASARGHNGLRSIQDVIGKGFTSVKIGIGRNYKGGKDSDAVSKYVLGKFRKEEREVLDGDVLEAFSEIVEEMKEGKYIYDVQKGA